MIKTSFVRYLYACICITLLAELNFDVVIWLSCYVVNAAELCILTAKTYQRLIPSVVVVEYSINAILDCVRYTVVSEHIETSVSTTPLYVQ